MSDQTKGAKKATRAAIICFFVEFTRTLLHRMNSWQFIMHHNKTNEKHNHKNLQQQNNKNEFCFHLSTIPYACRSHRISRMGRLRSRACARPVIFDFCLHLFTKPTYHILFHRVTGEGFTPFFLHLSFTLLERRKSSGDVFFICVSGFAFPVKGKPSPLNR